MVMHLTVNQTIRFESVKKTLLCVLFLCGTAGIGRQATLRSLCPYGRMGSSPLFRTKRGSGHGQYMSSRALV